MLGIKINLDKLLRKYPPEQVRGFLGDLAEMPELPEQARQSIKNILAQYNAGKPITRAMKHELNRSLEDLKAAEGKEK